MSADPHPEVILVTEGYTDEQVASRLLASCGLGVRLSVSGEGKDAITRDIGKWKAAARYRAVVVLRDLDEDASCAAELRAAIVGRAPPLLVFRIAVRAVETWLMADRAAFAAHFELEPKVLESDLEALANPRKHLLDLISRHAGRHIRERMLPAPGSRHRQGPLYATDLADFARQAWRPDRAARQDGPDSLVRAIRRLRELKRRLMP